MFLNLTADWMAILVMWIRVRIILCYGVTSGKNLALVDEIHFK